MRIPVWGQGQRKKNYIVIVMLWFSSTYLICVKISNRIVKAYNCTTPWLDYFTLLSITYIILMYLKIFNQYCVWLILIGENMKYVIQIKVPWLQLFIRTWNMKLSLNVRKLAQKWKLPPITSLSCTIRMRSKMHRLISQQRFSYLWKLSQNPWFRQVSKLYVQFSVPRLFKLGLYFQDKHTIFCFVSVADVGGSVSASWILSWL